MPKKARELSPLEVKRLTTPGRYAVGGVDGLFLRVTQAGSRSWILRYPTGERRQSQSGKPFAVYRDVGLGGYPSTSLAQAREKARAIRNNVAEGIDPVVEKKRAKQEALAQQLRNTTFAKAAQAVIKVKQAEAGNLKHAKQWQSSLETYAFPVLGDMAVADIKLTHVKQVLEPIWESKTVTATRVRQRIESVMAWATVHGHREGENPARWKGNLDAVLPAPSKIAKVEHHRAMPIDEMHAFMSALEKQEGMAAQCLAFTILTAVRSGNAIKASWNEIDLNAKVWTIPPDRILKAAGREHRVPLSDSAVKLLASLPRHAGTDLAFATPDGECLEDRAMSDVLKRMKVNDKATVHGFRSTFRDWAAERTSTPNHVAEMALAHTITNKAESAYRRGDLLAKRARLMQQWADFLRTPPAEEGSVTSIREGKVIAG